MILVAFSCYSFFKNGCFLILKLCDHDYVHLKTKSNEEKLNVSFELIISVIQFFFLHLTMSQ